MYVYTTYIRPLSVQAQYCISCPIISSSFYNSSLVTWTVVCLTAAKFKPLIFPVSQLALSNVANIFIFMILYCLPKSHCDWRSVNQLSLGVEPLYYSLTVTVLFLWGALPDERMGLSFVYAAGPRQVVFLGSESRGTRGHILLSQIWDFPFRRTDQRTENTAFSILAWRFCWGYHVIATWPVHWRAGCCPAIKTLFLLLRAGRSRGVHWALA
jgi:hypothetical protein